MVHERIKDIIKEFFNEEAVENIFNEIITKYSEPWRFFHTVEHIEYLLNRYKALPDNEHHYPFNKLLKLVIVYHDVVYFPWKTDNEEKSAYLFKFHFYKHIKDEYKDEANLKFVDEGILQTKKHDGKNCFHEVFNLWDMGVIGESFDKLLIWEHQIFKEFSFASIEQYKAGRVAFLKPYSTKPNIAALIHYIEQWKPTVAYYAGSFNPVHQGHIDIYNQAKTMFDKVVIMIGQNPMKPKITDDELKQRISDIQSVVPGTEIIPPVYDEFIPTILEKRSQHENTILIRGLRSAKDLCEEVDYIEYCKKIYDKLNVVYLVSDRSINHISSSGIKALNSVVKGSGDIYLPKKYDI